MIRRLRAIRRTVLDRFPESRLKPLTSRQLANLKKQFPGLPSHLLEFFKEFGCGRIGNSRYMLYDLISPDEIFDPVTATGLEGVVLIGDDFAGDHEAYNTKSDWQFGTVGGGGRFSPHSRYRDIVDFIEDWFATDEVDP